MMPGPIVNGERKGSPGQRNGSLLLGVPGGAGFPGGMKCQMAQGLIIVIITVKIPGEFLKVIDLTVVGDDNGFILVE